MGVVLPILLKLSLLGSVLAGLLLLLRPLLRRNSSKAFSYYLWLLVLLRLCVPVGLTILLPSVEDTPSTPADNMSQTTTASMPAQSEQRSVPIQGEQTAISAVPITPKTQKPSIFSDLPRQTKLPPASVLWTTVWLLGTLAFFGRYVWSYRHFSRAIRRSARMAPPKAVTLLHTLGSNCRVQLLESPLADTPMVMGVIRATIVLPVGVANTDRLRDILSHELTHIQRYDLLYKWFVAAVTSLHWFNPLMILIRWEISRACELSCDEAVMRGMDAAGRRHYGETLLALAASPSALPTLALCEEKEQLRERLVSIVKYKKRGPAAIMLSLLLATPIVGCAAIGGAQPTPAVLNAGDPNALSENVSALLEDVTLYEANGMAIAFPNDVYDQLMVVPSENENTLVEVYEKASYEAAQADFGEGARGGFLFAITRRDQAQYEQFLMSDGNGQSYFARDNTYYYCWVTATDVQLYRNSDLFTDEDIQEWTKVSQRVEAIKGDFIQRNGLTRYDDSEFFARDFLYNGEHLYASYSNWSTSMTLILSQPVKQGEGGIWCVERWYDDIGNGYYSLYMEGFPQTEGITAAEHYQQFQDQADAGQRPDLLDPQQAAAVWLQNYYSDTPSITVTLDDVILLEGEPGGNVWNGRIAPILMENGTLETVDYLNGTEYHSYRYELPADWVEQNMSLDQAAGNCLSSFLWCKTEPPQSLSGTAVQYTAENGDCVIFLEDGLVCIRRDNSQRSGGQEGTEEWFRPLNSSDSPSPYESMYSICQEWANYDNTYSQSTTSTNGASSQTVSPNASAVYEKLIAYKTEGYGQQSVANFNAALASTPDELTGFLAAVADVISTISPDDENYDFFTTTMSFSADELYREHMGEEFTFFITISKESRLCDYLDEYGEPVYEFTCFVDLNVPYSIADPKLVTVAERDKAFLTFKEEMQNYLNGLSEAEIAGSDIKKMLIDKSAELANSLSTENMRLSPCEIYLLEIIGEAEENKE